MNIKDSRGDRRECGEDVRAGKGEIRGATVLCDASDVGSDDGAYQRAAGAGAGMGDGAGVVQTTGADADAGRVGGVVREDEGFCSGDSSADGEHTGARCLDCVGRGRENQWGADTIRRIVTRGDANTIKARRSGSANGEGSSTSQGVRRVFLKGDAAGHAGIRESDCAASGVAGAG